MSMILLYVSVVTYTRMLLTCARYLVYTGARMNDRCRPVTGHLTRDHVSGNR